MRTLVFALVCIWSFAAAAGDVRGPLRQWQTLTIDYAGPASSETAVPNPFLDFRLQVLFEGPSGQTYSVPGFFAGDGSGGGLGSVWRVRFTPDEAGTWRATASFRSGPGVAVSVLADETPDPEAGVPAFFDGAVDVVEVLPADPAAAGFAAKGRLRYNRTHYLTFADGTPFVKGGADSPENWLGYVGFDNTPRARNTFDGHPGDWRPGDPDWDSPDTPEPNDGRAIIGALNYLAGEGVNSIYFLPMNIGGDGRDSWPYIGPIDASGDPSNDNTRFDISKLSQWEIFFSHAQRLGIFLHFVLAEAERGNKRELDDATLGPERRLYYRELAARFGHHLAMQWNVSEEYNLSLNIGSDEALRWARAIRGQDPYDHPVTVHNAGNPNNPSSGPWAPFIGVDPIDVTSLQRARQADGWGEVVAAYRAATAAAGKPIPVMIDEPASPTRDVASFDDFRRRVIWDVLISGGGGEWFINNRDQELDDFREFEQIWRETSIARRFVEGLPVQRMTPARGLVTGEDGFAGGAEVFAAAGEVYGVYLPEADAPGQTINLSGVSGPATLSWFNPRTGAFEGAPVTLAGGGPAAMGLPPSDPSLDWAALITAEDSGEPAEPVSLRVVRGDGDGTYLPGEPALISAEVPAGRVFDRWIGPGLPDPRRATATLPAPAFDAVVSAVTRPAGDALIGFSLVDANGDRVLAALPPGPALLVASNLPPLERLTLRADVAGPVGSVGFERDGAATQIENIAPYALGGDSGGDFGTLAVPLPLGPTQIAATAYEGPSASGDVLDAAQVTLRIVEGPCAADINGDGVVDAADRVAAVALPNGPATAIDLLETLRAIDAGCP